MCAASSVSVEQDAGLKPTKPSTERGSWRNVPLLTKKPFATGAGGKGRNPFSPVSLGVSTMFPRTVFTQEQLSRVKQMPGFFISCDVLFHLGYFLFERERMNMPLGR